MSLRLHDLSGSHTMSGVVTAHGAGDATADHVVARLPFAAKIVAVRVIAPAAVTGANTNSATLNVINRGTDGTGNTVLGSLALVSGANLAAFVPVAVYAPATPLSVAAGTVLTVQRALVGSGLATPELRVEVEFQGN